MATPESTARKRRVAPPKEVGENQEDRNTSDNTKTKPSTATNKHRKRTHEEDDYTPWLDIIRVATFLFVASCGLSYVISNGESWFWGMQHRPDYLSLAWWKKQYVGDGSPYYSEPRYFTLEELAAYDGSDERKPIYLSINGTVYDVTAGRRIYGPGGSYHHFAGVDASRGFVTGCFAADRTGDVRGVEEMFLPLDNPEIDKHWTPKELAKKRADELKEAHQRVHDALKHWVDFFAKSKKYHYVGRLRREPGWEGELKPLCQPAQEGRVHRTIPEPEG